MIMSEPTTTEVPPTLEQLKERYFKLYAKENLGKSPSITKILDELEEKIKNFND